MTNADTARRVYQYDSLGQVTSGKKYWSDGTPVAGQQFEYTLDDIGTRMSFRGLKPPTISRVQNHGKDYTYDLNGNMRLRGTQALEYDVYNRLIKVRSVSGNIAEFGYAAGGERLWKTSGGQLTQVWIGGHYEEKDGKVLFHVLAAGRRICTFEAAAAAATGYNPALHEFYYYHPDHLGSSSIMTERNGNEVQHHEYSAYGRDRYTSSSTAFPVSRRFTGQILDSDTGLYYYGARYYDPELGRFIQPDTIIPDLDNPQSYNRYSYVVNNPLKYVDPDGHLFFLAPLLWGLVAGGAGYGGIAVYEHTTVAAANVSHVQAMDQIASSNGKYLSYDEFRNQNAATATKGSPDSVRAGGSLGAAGFTVEATLTSTIVPSAVKPGQMSAIQSSTKMSTLAREPAYVPIAKKPLDPTRYARHATSRVLEPNTAAGEYAYVVDAKGVVHIAESGQHMHPQVLGGGQPATGAGQLKINSRGAVTYRG